MADVLSFHVVPGAQGITHAEQRLRALGFTQIRRSHDDRHLHVVATKAQIEHVLGVTLIERYHEVQVGPVKRRVIQVDLAEGTTVPDHLRDAMTDIIFSQAPNYHGFAPSRP